MMKMNKRMVSVLVLGMACLMVMPGCRKNKNKAGGIDPDIVGGVRPIEEGGMGEYGLGEGMRLDEYGIPYGSEFMPVLFEYDSARISPDERMKADTVASEMRIAADTHLVVEGHCDERGDREYNLALGERRALAVRAYIIELGIDAARITTKSYGEENPVAMGHDEASYRQNRRAELKLFTVQ